MNAVKTALTGETKSSKLIMEKAKITKKKTLTVEEKGKPRMLQ